MKLTPRRRLDCNVVLPPLSDESLLPFENAPQGLLKSRVSPLDDQGFGRQFQQLRTPSPLGNDRTSMRSAHDSPGAFNSSSTVAPSRPRVQPRPPPRPPPKPRWIRDKQPGIATPAIQSAEAKVPEEVIQDAPLVSEVRIPAVLVPVAVDRKRCINGLLRPGVTEECLLTSCRLIQTSWRRWCNEKQIHCARHQLEGKMPVTTPSSPSTNVIQAAPQATSIYSGILVLKDDPAVVWDEALSYRQPSVEQVMQTQRRWLQHQLLESGSLFQQSQLDILMKPEVSAMIRGMAKFERRLQLRGREDLAGFFGWRPPSAVGASVCKEIEGAVDEWYQALRRIDEVGGAVQVLPLLQPCICLFELVIACSFISRNQLASAHRILKRVEQAAVTAIPGTFMHIAALQLRGRAELHLARVDLAHQGFEDAVSKAQQALVWLEDRHGPRFWPVHCWELALCHRTVALGFAGMCRLKDAHNALGKILPLLAPASMRQAQPELVQALSEDIQVLDLECRVALQVDSVSERDPKIPEELQMLSGHATEFLAGIKGDHALARVHAIAAKLALLQEIPWAAAGSARVEVLDATSEKTKVAQNGIRALGAAALAQKVTPLEVSCAVLRGDVSAALSCAQLWSRNCQRCFGDRNTMTQAAFQLVNELKAQSEAGSDSSRSRQAISRSLRKVLQCVGVGVRELILSNGQTMKML
eukprot:gnl/MRDRNA2_/MRDRNA2_36302_c0_seq1.p1 gnl/MRDRNA2_/MRDRNA2_36302_c0~~gnl/MRDRNA2_/MRDRNA2_36302_c0_seq1.p1  ORF type:complete len:698 (-),score=144.19 gnl/MRDRNA2_/MRDRNA2_36302_c0_seq1:5-2098(-)